MYLLLLSTASVIGRRGTGIGALAWADALALGRAGKSARFGFPVPAFVLALGRAGTARVLAPLPPAANVFGLPGGTTRVVVGLWGGRFAAGVGRGAAFCFGAVSTPGRE